MDDFPDSVRISLGNFNYFSCYTSNFWLATNFVRWILRSVSSKSEIWNFRNNWKRVLLFQKHLFKHFLIKWDAQWVKLMNHSIRSDGKFYGIFPSHCLVNALAINKCPRTTFFKEIKALKLKKKTNKNKKEN